MTYILLHYTGNLKGLPHFHANSLDDLFNQYAETVRSYGYPDFPTEQRTIFESDKEKYFSSCYGSLSHKLVIKK